MYMKTNLTFSNLQGRKDDAKLHTVSEFCRIVANETATDLYGYFSNFYAAFLADSYKEQKQENETVSDFRNRLMRKAFQQVKSTKTSDLKNTDLYKIFVSKNQLFKLVRTISPCFYDDEMKHKFAKRKVIAFNTKNLTSEQVKDYTNVGYKVFTLKLEQGVKVFEFITKEFKTVDGAFSANETADFYTLMLNKQRKQRKDKFEEIKETGVYFFDAKENISTMVEHDKMNFRTMYTYISEYAQKQNFEKVQNQQDKERREKTQKDMMKASKKLDAAVSTAFNKLLDWKMKAQQENGYITDETKRNLLQADAIRLTALYKDACRKRFADWNEAENGLLSDVSVLVRKLTIDAPKAKKTTKTAKNKKAA